MDSLTQTMVATAAVNAIKKVADDFQKNLKSQAESFLPPQSASIDEIADGLSQFCSWEKRSQMSWVNLYSMAKSSGEES